MKIVKGKEMRQELVRMMKAQPKELIAVWEPKDKGILVSALDENDLDNMVRMIKTEVVEKPVEVEDSSLPCLSTPAWLEVVARIQQQHSGLVSIKFVADNQVIMIITLKALIELIVEDVVNFLKENTTLEQFLKMDFGTARLIKQFMPKKLKSICEKVPHNKVLDSYYK